MNLQLGALPISFGVLSLVLGGLAGASDRSAAGSRSGPGSVDTGQPVTRDEEIRTRFAGLPTSFVENLGQWEESVRFIAREDGVTAYLSPDSVTFQWLEREEGPDPRTMNGSPGRSTTPSRGEALTRERCRGMNLRFLFERSRVSARLVGRREEPARFNYFLGPDPARWRTNVPGFQSVAYEDLYEGVDLVLRKQEGRFEYDVALAPAADLSRVRIRVEGAVRPLRLDAAGDLRIDTALGEVRQPRPITWEEADGGRRPVDCRYVLLDEYRFGFEVTGRNPLDALQIDPGLLFSTYFGSYGTIRGLALTSTGEPVVAGFVTLATLPTSPGAFDTTWNGLDDAFVAKLTSDGGGLVYATYLGGPNSDRAAAVDLDSSGQPTVVGSAGPSFPTTPGAFQTTNGGPSSSSDVFVTTLTANGQGLLWSTYLGASTNPGADEQGNGLAVSPSGSATVVGLAWAGFPTTPGAFQTTPPYGGDAFITTISGSGASLVSSTYLGGSGGNSNATAVALRIPTVGAVVEAFVVGTTNAPGFPIVGPSFDPTFDGGPQDGFLASIYLPSGILSASTFLGGTGFDSANGVADAVVGGALVTGSTNSFDFPTTAGAFATTISASGGLADAFVARINMGSGLFAAAYSTYLGGSGGASGSAVARDSTGAAVVVGGTAAADFPVTAGAFDTTYNGPGDGFVAKLSPSGGSLLYSTFLAGTGSSPYSENLVCVDLEPTGTATVAGRAPVGFPTTPGAFGTTGSFWHGVIARLDLVPISGVSVYGSSTAGCAGASTIGATTTPQVGNAGFAVTCANAPQAGLGFLALSAGQLATPLPVQGVQVWVDPAAGFFLLFPAGSSYGWSAVGLPVPANGLLVGLQLFAQYFWVDPCGPAGASASSGLGIVIQP